MKYEDPGLNEVRDAATAVGEVVAVAGDLITIRGDFSPGLAIALHPGARVQVFSDTDAICAQDVGLAVYDQRDDL